MDLRDLWVDALLIFILIVVNGFFSAAEIAMVTIRRSRVTQLVEQGKRGAQVVAALKDDSGSFLATVQVGVTLVGSMASVLGGAAAIAVLQPMIRRAPLPLLQEWSAAIAMGIVVLTISYLTLVMGELVPKSLALSHSDGFACLTAPLIQRLSRLFSPLIALLTCSTNAILRLFGQRRPPTDTLFSEEEVKHIVSEGTYQGVFDEAEQELIHSVFEFTDTSVREVMVPRSDIHAVEVRSTLHEALDNLLAIGFSRAPVYDGDLEHVVGVVHIKDLLRSLHSEPPVALGAIMHPALFVPDSMPISDLLRDLQSHRRHMAIVLNEFGTVIGLATIEDLLEEIVGEIRDEFDTDEEHPIQQLPDGSLLVEGSVLLNDLKEKYDLPFEETQDYRTIAGFIFARLRRIPKGGETLTHDGLRMTVVTIDDRRLRKVRIERPSPPAV